MQQSSQIYGQQAIPIYPVSNYTFGKKERVKPAKDENLRMQRLKTR